MKTTTKFFAIAAVVLASITTLNVQAQTMTEPMAESFTKTWRLGFGINGGLFKKSSALDYGYGADVRLQWDLAPALSVTATAGYTRLVPASNLLPDIDFIPVKGGVKIFPIGMMYIASELGAGLAIKNGAKTNLIYNMGIGYAFSGGFDVGARYEGYVNDSSSSTYFTKTGQFNLRLAYGFKL